jgi:hypothetical protein
MRTPSPSRREQQSTHVAVSDIISDKIGLHTVNRREQVAGVDAGDEQVCFAVPLMLAGRSTVVRGDNVRLAIMNYRPLMKY